MNVLRRIWQSSLGKKYLMALTGAGMSLFVIGHLLGNLQIFAGAAVLNRYAHFLQTNVEMLWTARLGLVLLLGVHVVTAIKLSLENQQARPVEYGHGQAPYGAPLASRMMLVVGLAVGCFVTYHLLHYTVKVEAINLGAGNFQALKEVLQDGSARPDVFAMMISGFSQPWVVLFYVLGIGLLSYHLSHGLGAMFQSVGLKNRAYGAVIDRAAKIVAVALFLGYAAIPVAVLLGYGKARPAQTQTSLWLKPVPAVTPKARP